jgi:hypothetical protein
MNKTYPIFIILSIIIAAFSACNSSDDETTTYVYSNTAITAFSLAADDSVLENLDSVYFSIDLINARIYNADSMPYGTDISKLVVNITTSSCSALEITIPRENQEDTTINYLTNSTDSLDFSLGRASIHIVSYDGSASRDYDLRINVHKIKPDSLYWNDLALRTLPSALSNPTDQKTVEYQGKMVCLTSSSAGYSIVTAINPGNETADTWTTNQISLDFTPVISSFAATDDALYLLSSNGTLYSSTDTGLTWSSCGGATWTSLIGGYESALIGVQNINGSYYTVSYPDGNAIATKADFPISGSSAPIVFTTKWNITPQLMIIGGRTASGELTGDTWGFDGYTWAKISQTSCPALEGMTMFPYFTFRTNTDNWAVSEFTTWIALGGINADKEAQKTVYISLDQGMNWKEADDLLQLPDYVPAMYGSQTLIFSTTMTESARSSLSPWSYYASKELPRYWTITTNSSRATTPITSWDCPYIYMFGGYDANGTLYDTLWRGVINRLTFKPLQ